MDKRVFLLVAAFLSLAPSSRGLMGYDCGDHGLNITSLSLLDIGSCDLENIEPVTRDVYVQLFQLSDFDRTRVIQCKVEIDRTIYYCGMHSHVSVVHGGRRIYLHELAANNCKRIHETGAINLGGREGYITGLKPNSTSARSITLAGHASVDGRCSGSQYSDSYRTWDSVIVQATVRVTLRDFESSIRRSSHEIILPSGLHCKVAAGECLDTDGEETFWSHVPPDSCHFSHYDVLYEGQANKLTPKFNQTTPTIYTVTTRETTFALTQTMEISLCGYTLIQTEHPKLFILETQPDRAFRVRSKISVNNLDIFAYVNSKFVYVEKHIRTQLTRLYRDIMDQKCALEKQILLNALALSIAVIAGEALHLIKCVPVECRIRHTEECSFTEGSFIELPVAYENKSAFLLPGSRILTLTGTHKDSSELLPTMYKIHGTWFRFMPRSVESLPPPIIQPLTRPTWKCISPAELATSGIYSDEDLSRLRNHIMFPVEKPRMLNTLAREAMGHNIPPGSISMTNLFDEKSLEKIAESVGARLCKGFITFGSASAGVMAIFLIINLIKLIVDTIIHGYALHSVYGWSLHLLGTIWSSVAHLLLYLTEPRKRDTMRQQDEEALVLTARPLSKTHSTPEDRPPTLTAPVLTESASEKPICYKELRAM
ncbi:hypothetical protein ALC60_11197 [Trachymyrmex zeteki]|uniref:Glycoprotein n=1 Tax=Mycetomoellerius zeteki TaxID=64791 RepID=A0A151WPH7_9HYME|nr:hypothetical protein ALC60_11197 [Trachymyrmex zeteki]